MFHSLKRFLVLLGIGFGSVVIIMDAFPIIRKRLPTHTVLYPLPHQIPKYPGGTSFRFAMVHDVVHDRYPRHGSAYYQERNRQVRAAIEKNKDADGLPPPDQFGLIDDLGVGLDILGEHDEAVRWLRLKLKAQETLGLQGKALYTSYANLGTFIIHGSAARAMQGDKAAQERVREGLRYLHQSIEVNPDAHFGREIWQAVIGKFMLAVSKNRRLLLEYDMIGNSLKDDYHAGVGPQAFSTRSFHNDTVRQVDGFLKNPVVGNDRERLRTHINVVGSEDILRSWKPVPFDEPCLGIIGMWRLGGGANPHFALALGETMMRVNQRRLAWSAYQRAIREAKRFSSDEEVRAKFIEHCKARQKAFPFNEEETKELERRCASELLIGQGFQRAYQKYEEEQIAAGKDLDDPHFYDAFNATYGNIATPIGEADFLAVQEVTPRAISWTVFAIGTLVFVVAVSLLLWQRRQNKVANPPSPQRIS
jgi:hypothetical protein